MTSNEAIAIAHAFMDKIIEFSDPEAALARYLSYIFETKDRSLEDDKNLKEGSGTRRLEPEVLETLSLGLLALYSHIYPPPILKKDAVKSSLMPKLLQFLRISALGETDTSQHGSASQEKSKSLSLTWIQDCFANVVTDDPHFFEKSITKELEANDALAGLSEKFFLLDNNILAELRQKFCVQFLVSLAKDFDFVRPMLQEIDVCIGMLEQSTKREQASNDALLLPDVVKIISAFLQHQQFAVLFVEGGGIQSLLAIARDCQMYNDLSSCLSALHPSKVIERICGLPSDVVLQVVDMAFQLFECPLDQAREAAVLFFSKAFVFSDFIQLFDAQQGLQKLLYVLGKATSGTSGSQVLTLPEMRLASRICLGLQQYFRVQFVLFLHSIFWDKKSDVAVQFLPYLRVGCNPMNISDESMDSIVQQMEDGKVSSALAGLSWPILDTFLSCDGHLTMLELCQASKFELSLDDFRGWALDVLHTVTLVPYAHKFIINASLSNDCAGIAVILDAAKRVNYSQPLDTHARALSVLVNLTRSPSASGIHRSAPVPTVTLGLTGDSGADLGAGLGCTSFTAEHEEELYDAEKAIIANNGIEVLVKLLQLQIISFSGHLERCWALACRVLLSFARHGSIAARLSELQVG